MNLEVELIAGVIKGGPPPAHLPAPRLIKIFIAGERDEFVEERKQILEGVGPELQAIYDDMGIEVLLVDMQYGTDKDPDVNPRLAELFLEEITASHRHSRGCFFLLLVGAAYKSGWVPTKFTQETYKALLTHCNFLEEYYTHDGDCYVLKASSEETAHDDWHQHESNLRKALKIAAESAILEYPDNTEIKNILQSTAERQLEHGLSLDEDGNGVIAIVRNWSGSTAPTVEPGASTLKSRIGSSLPEENVMEYEVEYKPGGIDSDCLSHDKYLTRMRQQVLDRIQFLVNESVETDPEIKSRKKMVQAVYAESLAHLSLLRNVSPADEDVKAIGQIKELLLAGRDRKHGPVLVWGPKSSGKSAILATVYEKVPSWFNGPTVRIVRLCTSTPRSAYSLELLRVLCEHIGFLSGNNDGNLPRDASFDPLYLNNWFSQIMRGIEENPMSEQLVILVDDLHRLHPLECDIVAALSWLPLNLPKGVHFIATTAVPPEALRLTPLQKERLRSPEILIELPEVKSNVPDVEAAFDRLERLIGHKAANRIGSLLACTEYGLSETEILELIMPTGDDGPLVLASGQFGFATWCLVRRTMTPWLKVRVMSGRLMFSWRWSSGEMARKRYLATQDASRSAYGEVANLFFTEDSEESDQKPPEDSDSAPAKETPFQSAPRSQDITYTIRHVEEAWLHLLRAGDVDRLKRLAVCAFDFLLAAVQMISVSYLRCVLEHARRYLLERDLELVYYAVRKSSDVLTRDPLQLGAQLICWLRPVAEDEGDLVSRMVMAAMAWCDGYAAPLLVPLNGWLQPPLPLQIRALSCPQGVRLIEAAPSGQHVVVVPPQGDAELWHVMSGQLVHTFKGHSGPISCLAITKQSQYLMTGSEDTSIIVWDMKELIMKQRICEHIAPVLSLTPAMGNSIIVSGGEDSRIIATRLLTGEVLMKVDHHRGPVTSLRVDSAGEVLVSGSYDATVCLWSLESFTLLNTIPLPSPVTMLDVSTDSVFLLAACEDKKLYLRSLATGTEIHTLRGHQGPIKSVCLAKDCRRAVAGGVDGRVSVFDMHSGRLTKALPASPSADVTSVKVTEKDDFLITAGGGRVTYWSFRGEEVAPRPTKSGGKQESLQPHGAPISCLDVSRDGAMAVTGGVDSLVNLWQLNTHELVSTLEGHIASVTCVAFSASGLFAASGSEDKTVRVWGLTLGLVVATFKHQAPVTAVTVMLDGRRVVSSDRGGAIRVWAADSGTLIQSLCGPGRCFAVASDMRYTVCGSGDNHIRILGLGLGPEEKYPVSHSQDITCLVVTPDSQSLITGSRDMSLKVWQLAGGKLSQVLVGHTDHVTCVAVAVSDKSIVVSGSRDANLIVWDINTGADLHTLTGHLGYVTCIRLSGDGTLAVSGSEDKSLIVWDTKKGTALSSIMLHVPVLGVEMSTDCSRLALHLLEHKCLPILCLHNTPAQYVKLPEYVAPRDLRPPGPKRPARRLLKKEVSLDTYTWQRKYGHLTSGIMVAAVEERLKRRFSVSASMEEISKAGLAGSQPGLGPEQAALAQSQHFDQLEALWNKQSPPPRPRGLGRTLSKQSSLQATRISDSEEEAQETGCTLHGYLPG
ncbi:protein qui-1 isoform X1 [Neodiprion fabricii]|uniref:protein qui-1 isoform X1 n=1 Tax=Neodiprion fabricii TaxID=2872261 RepID=UPI001ED8D9A7|nr:protein qui-1 isoform X1 [Neodiprion fabricii]XP_046435931.1 protein qui-1 isoform X1 [Neodiprion fabricii]XP_046435932.1 protein qui-1 isoform X1 [Neodiprion fabricii]XP_046435933.1 protein qui-1 isoform X1 [Neodiprion fabricii]XP_046435934.1 protein qui-1 isoform X1 [Neodiprion fabricii]